MELMMVTKPESIGAFFELWVGNDGDWGRVDVYVRKWKKHFKSKTATKRWMTRAQVKAHFVEEEVANAMCDAAESRKNPDPGAAKLEAGNQFHVTSFDVSVKEKSKVKKVASMARPSWARTTLIKTR